MDHGIPRKHNIWKRNMKKLNNKIFLHDIYQINWNSKLQTNKNNVNLSFDNFYTGINFLLDKHVPLRKISKKEFKLKVKPWITPGIIISIRKRDKLLKKFINCKNQENKEILHNKYKLYRNLIVTLTRKSKKNHYQKYFQENSSNIKKHGMESKALSTYLIKPQIQYPVYLLTMKSTITKLILQTILTLILIILVINFKIKFILQKSHLFLI